MRNVLIMGAGGRDFHVFLRALRDDPDVRVVAFTAAQIPGIDHRVFPASLAGARYPAGIPIRPEAELEALITHHDVHEVVLAYSDLSYPTGWYASSWPGRSGSTTVTNRSGRTNGKSLLPPSQMMTSLSVSALARMSR